MWEKQILTKVIEIQKENLGLNNHAFFFQIPQYVAFFFQIETFT